MSEIKLFMLWITPGILFSGIVGMTSQNMEHVLWSFLVVTGLWGIVLLAAIGSDTK